MASREEAQPLDHLEAADPEAPAAKDPPQEYALSNLGPLPAAPPSDSPAVQGSTRLPLPRPVTVTEPVKFVPEEEIWKNRLSEEELRRIPRFSSYSPGEPSKVGPQLHCGCTWGQPPS